MCSRSARTRWHPHKAARRHRSQASSSTREAASSLAPPFSSGTTALDPNSRPSATRTALFSVPALAAGSYSVTVSLAGFKTAVINDLRASIGQPLSVKATLEVGNLEETVVVQSSSDIVNTQTATISSTLNVDQINKMPMPTATRSTR